MRTDAERDTEELRQALEKLAKETGRSYEEVLMLAYELTMEEADGHGI